MLLEKENNGLLCFFGIFSIQFWLKLKFYISLLKVRLSILYPKISIGFLSLCIKLWKNNKFLNFQKHLFILKSHAI